MGFLKSYSNRKIIYFCGIPGCRKAEIKPVEPDQGNACEGKAAPLSAYFSPLYFPFILKYLYK